MSTSRGPREAESGRLSDDLPHHSDTPLNRNRPRFWVSSMQRRMQQGAANEESEEEDRKQQQPKTNVPATHFSSADKELLDSGKFADAKVVANGKTHDVHRSVLCTRCKWFRTVFESGFREGQTSVVEITAPDNIPRLLEFLYTGAVDLSEEADILTAANELSVLGDFYLSEELNGYATQVLGQYLGEHLTAISDRKRLMEIPRQYQTQNLIETGRNAWGTGAGNFRIMQDAGFVDRLCAAIREAYATPSGISSVYVDFVCAARFRTFECPLIQALKDEIPEFGADLLTAMMSEPRTSVFDGNKAFERWKDPLFRGEFFDSFPDPYSYGAAWYGEDRSPREESTRADPGVHEYEPFR